jgi:type VI secretion system protein ImpH
VSAPPGGAEAPAAGGGPPAPLGPEELARRIAAARRLGAYPLLLLLERLHGERGRIGTSAMPSEERIRLRHDPALAFRPGEVSAVALRPPPGEPEPGEVPAVDVTTAFLGLSGAASPLPPYLPEEVAQEDDEAPRRRDFLDLFHHRFISLYYRARARADFPNGYRSDQGDAWSRRVLAFAGREGPTRVPAWRLLRWAPLLAERNVTAAALEAAVADLLEDDVGAVGVTVEPFAGGWAAIDPDDRNRLGRDRSRLGADLVLGARILDRAGRIRVVVGPLSRAELAAFRARADLPLRIAEAVRELCPPALAFDLLLWLSRDAAPHLELGRARLGRDAWLGGQRRETRVRVEVPA